MSFSVKPSDWILLSPEIFLTASGLLVLSLAVSFGKAKEEFLSFLSILAVAVTGCLVVFVSAQPNRATPILGGTFVVDNFALFFKALILLSLLLTILASVRFVGAAPYPGGEYYALLLFAGVGMLFMVSGNNLISIYVALELMALASYILAGYFKAEVKSTEAALKYFILGAFSSGVLLYGLSLVYGLARVMGLPELAKVLASAERSNLLMLGILLILAGLLFKIAAVPFHVWTPDVYEGSPTPVTAFFSVGPKVAAYGILARIFYVAFPRFHADWGLIVALVSAATMVFGNVAALLQTNVKRMLAYSSIANAGYALLGVLGFRTEWGLWGILVYLLAYTFMNFGAFTLVIFLETHGLRRRVGLRLRGPREAAHARGDRDAALPPVARRDPADGRLHRQVLPVRGGDEGRLRVAGGARRGDVGGLALLLLPHRGGDVLLGRRRREDAELLHADRGRRDLRRGHPADRRRSAAGPRPAARLRPDAVGRLPYAGDVRRRLLPWNAPARAPATPWWRRRRRPA